MSALPMSRLTMNPTAVLSSVLAQIDPVKPSKDFPGADLLANLLQWGMYLSLALSVGSIDRKSVV